MMWVGYGKAKGKLTHNLIHKQHKQNSRPRHPRRKQQIQQQQRRRNNPINIPHVENIPVRPPRHGIAAEKLNFNRRKA